jgi:hypothetical protein
MHFEQIKYAIVSPRDFLFFFFCTFLASFSISSERAFKLNPKYMIPTKKKQKEE